MKYPIYLKKTTGNEENKVSLNKMTLAKRILYGTEYFILNEHITGYDSFLLRRKNTQNFYALLKRFFTLYQKKQSIKHMIL